MIGYEHDIQQLQTESLNITTAASNHEEDQQQLVLDVLLLEATCSELRGLLLRNVQITIADGTQHCERVATLEEELSRYKTQYQKLEEKMQFMVETLQGLCKRAHGMRMKSLDELATSLGYLKRQWALLRTQLAPLVVTRVQYQNRQIGKKKRLAGDSDIQRRTIECVANILSQGEAVALINQLKMNQGSSAVTKDVLKMIGQSLGPDTMMGRG